MTRCRIYLGPACEEWCEELDGDQTLKGDIARQEDDAHSATPELALERISAGNGGLEIINWMMMAATVAGKKGSAVYYEPMNQWFTGMGGVAMSV